VKGFSFNIFKVLFEMIGTLGSLWCTAVKFYLQYDGEIAEKVALAAHHSSPK
jgi:hypothetical protein